MNYSIFSRVETLGWRDLDGRDRDKEFIKNNEWVTFVVVIRRYEQYEELKEWCKNLVGKWHLNPEKRYFGCNYHACLHLELEQDLILFRMTY